MKAQHLHHKSASRTILNSINPENFAPMRLSAKALSDDSCWDEYDSDFEESLPSHMLSCFESTDFES
jgi:hypothetical protein